EVMVPLFVKGATERGIPLTWAARLIAENPAKHFRLDHIKVALTPGKDADIVERQVVDAAFDRCRKAVAAIGARDIVAAPER
ncbi:hypothetical protein AB9E34_33750, partial [Rhizobium leguminosarum]